MLCRTLLLLVLVVAGLPAQTHAQPVLNRDIARVDRELLAACRWAQTRPDEALRQRAQNLWQQRARLLAQGARVSQLPAVCRQRLARIMEPAPIAGRHWRGGSRGSKGHAYRRAAPPRVQPAETAIPPPSLAPAPERPPVVGSPAPTPERRPAAANGSTPTPPSAPLPDMFPWPPPTASTRRSFSPDVVVDAPPARNLGESATRLEGLLRQADFDTWGYFRAPNGFALVTRVERLDGNTGLALTREDRWSDRAAYASISPGAILRAIFSTSRPRGYYRVMVFIVTDDPPMTRPTGGAETFQITSLWAQTGRSSLPPDVEAQPVTANHELIVLIYEFEKVSAGETTLYTPSRWSFDHHLDGLHLTLKRPQ